MNLAGVNFGNLTFARVELTIVLYNYTTTVLDKYGLFISLKTSVGGVYGAKKKTQTQIISLYLIVSLSHLSHIRLYSIPPPLSNLFLTHTCHQPSAATTVAHHHPPPLPSTTVGHHHHWEMEVRERWKKRGRKKKTEV